VAILIPLVIYDIISSFYISKEGKKGGFCSQLLRHHTLKVKLTILTYYVLCLASLILDVLPNAIGGLLIGMLHSYASLSYSVTFTYSTESISISCLNLLFIYFFFVYLFVQFDINIFLFFIFLDFFALISFFSELRDWSAPHYFPAVCVQHDCFHIRPARSQVANLWKEWHCNHSVENIQLGLCTVRLGLSDWRVCAVGCFCQFDCTDW
jgi:hypothetical protein